MEKKKTISISKKLKAKYIEEILKRQNERRKKYGLQPLKRIYLEHFLYTSDDNRITPDEYKPYKEGGMYQ